MLFGLLNPSSNCLDVNELLSAQRLEVGDENLVLVTLGLFELLGERFDSLLRLTDHQVDVEKF